LIPDADIWRAAMLITRYFRRGAADQIAACADDLAASDAREASMWRRIAVAVERLQATKPSEGESVQ